MNLVEIIGSLAAISSAVSLIPQITKVLKTRSTDDLSYGMLFLFLITSLLWVTYGLMISSAAVWGCNVFMTLTAILLLALKQKYGSKSV